MAGATSIFPVKLFFYPFSSSVIKLICHIPQRLQKHFLLKTKKLLQFFSKILIVNICITKYCKIMTAGQFLYIKYLWNRNKLLLLLQISQHKIIHHSREKSHNWFQIGRCLKRRSTFIFLKTEYPLSSFQRIMLKRLHYVKNKNKTKRTKTMYFFIRLTPGRRAFWGKRSKRVWQIGNFV